MKYETEGQNSFRQAIMFPAATRQEGEGHWKLGFTIGFGHDPRIRNIKAQDLKALGNEIQGAKKRFGLADDTAVLSCYEAGRDGFWLHRYLRSMGIENQIVDSSSLSTTIRNTYRKRPKKVSIDCAEFSSTHPRQSR